MGASKTTSFSTTFRKLLVAIGVTFVASVLGAPIYVAAVPYLLVMTRMVKSQPGETAMHWWAKFAILQIFYGGFLLLAAVAILYPVFGLTLTGYHSIALYVPMATISRHDRRYQYGVLTTPIVQMFFDVPLVVTGYVCREFFGLRLLAPFCDIFDDTIVQGSMPFPSDIATLAAEPYNVGMIVNMCREYGGATEAMNKHGIYQCHLPHQDTTAVSYESLVKGCEYISAFKKHSPHKRVYVHCKGGIGRASTMSLAHYMVNEGRDPAEALADMKSKRPIVYAGVRDYPAIVKLNEERLSKEKEGDSERKKQ